MENVAKRHRRVSATTLSILILGAAGWAEKIAYASPPIARPTAPAHWPGETTAPHPTGLSRGDFGRLDLRAPKDFSAMRSAGSEPSSSESSTDIPFPSVRRSAASAPREEEQPGFGNSGFKSMSRAEELARRFHREGLPLARLWESHSALVSVGLSPRGKPGIWLIQKVP
jgi:hypothetical protein